MMRSLCLSMTVVSFLAFDENAEAHAFLLKSEPVVGATVTAPKSVRLEFSEGVELRFSGIELDDASSNAIPKVTVHYGGNDRKFLFADLPPLPPGTYRVKWHVVSVDTHRTEGDFSFTVKP
jgi:copper resistance protein C